MINYPSLRCLWDFLQAPSAGNVAHLISMPAIYGLVKKYADIEGIIPILHWMEGRARDVLNTLVVDPTPLEVGGAVGSASWVTVRHILNAGV